MKDALEQLHDLLPTSVQTLIGVIGLDATYRLVELYGGRTLRVAMAANKIGERRSYEMEEVIGAIANQRLTATYGGEQIYIPKCDVALREYRNRVIRKAYDDRTKTESANAVVNDLAMIYKLSDSRVWRILKQVDIDVLPAPRRIDDKTIDMFGE